MLLQFYDIFKSTQVNQRGERNVFCNPSHFDDVESLFTGYKSFEKHQ